MKKDKKKKLQASIRKNTPRKTAQNDQIFDANVMNYAMSQIVKDKEINPLYNSKHGLSIQKHNRLLDSTPSKRSTSVFLDHPMKDHQPVSQFDSCDFVDKIKRHE